MNRADQFQIVWWEMTLYHQVWLTLSCFGDLERDRQVEDLEGCDSWFPRTQTHLPGFQDGASHFWRFHDGAHELEGSAVTDASFDAWSNFTVNLFSSEMSQSSTVSESGVSDFVAAYFSSFEHKTGRRTGSPSISWRRTLRSLPFQYQTSWVVSVIDSGMASC
jgi:hypothetical protein